MTVLFPAWLQTGSYNAEVDRYVPSSLVAPNNAVSGRGGVRHYDGNDLKVSATGPASMQVSIAAGTALVLGTYSSTQGVYAVINDGAVSLSLASSSATQDRIDLIVLQVLDQAYSGSSNTAQLAVVQGLNFPAGTASPPVAPQSSLILAQVLVSRNVTSISSSAITDARTFSAGAGGIIPVLNATQRTSASFPRGAQVMEIDTLRYYQLNGSTWVYQGGGTHPTVSITPASGWANWSAVNGGVFEFLRGVKIGQMVHVQGLLINTVDFSNYKKMFQLPSGWAPERQIVSSAFYNNVHERIDVQQDGGVYANAMTWAFGAGGYWAINIHMNIRNDSIG